MEKKDNVVEFETPLMRGETEIKSVELIKPNAGSLRGVRLPALTKAECNALDPVDLIALGGKVIGFLQSKSDE